MGNENKVPYMLNLRDVWMWVVSFTHRSH